MSILLEALKQPNNTHLSSVGSSHDSEDDHGNLEALMARLGMEQSSAVLSQPTDIHSDSAFLIEPYLVDEDQISAQALTSVRQRHSEATLAHLETVKGSDKVGVNNPVKHAMAVVRITHPLSHRYRQYLVFSLASTLGLLLLGYVGFSTWEQAAQRHQQLLNHYANLLPRQAVYAAKTVEDGQENTSLFAVQDKTFKGSANVASASVNPSKTQKAMPLADNQQSDFIHPNQSVASQSFEIAVNTKAKDQQGDLWVSDQTGFLFAEQGRWSQAQSAFLEAFNADNQCLSCALNLAISYDHLGQYASAIAYYRYVLGLPIVEEMNIDPLLIERRVVYLQSWLRRGRSDAS